MLASSPRQRLIAVIEDDAAVLHSLEFSLEAQGYRVCPFARPSDAIESGEIMAADCLIADYGLPDIDGLTMLKALRDRGLSCPAIIIASTPTIRCRTEAAKAGAPLLEKPLMGRELDHLLRAMLSAAR